MVHSTGRVQLKDQLSLHTCPRRHAIAPRHGIRPMHLGRTRRSSLDIDVAPP